MTNGNDMAYPLNFGHGASAGGLTKREHIAAMAVQGMLASIYRHPHQYKDGSFEAVAVGIAKHAAQLADVLTAALNVPVCPYCKVQDCGYSKEHDICPLYEKYAGDQP